MATLYVENVPEELYEALRVRARSRHRSIAAEILSLLEETIPTARELKARHEFVRRLERMRARPARNRGQFPSTEEMQREDRAR
jgi:plasmid stability protein